MVKRILYFLFASLITFQGHAQDSLLYKHDFLSPQFHQNRRQALRDAMPANSVAVFFSAPVRVRSNDVEYDYHQDPDFYYLTGINEPEAMLLLFKENQTLGASSGNEFVFVQEKDPKKETWTGRRLGVDGAKGVSGIQPVFINSMFEGFTIDFSKFAQVLEKENAFEECVNSGNTDGQNNLLIASYKSKTKAQHSTQNAKLLSGYMQHMRQVKLKEELALMKIAIDITCAAEIEVFKYIEPGMSEYQAQAVLEYVFKEQGCEYPAFPSIVGSGANSCILHYTTNRKKFQAGDMVVVDIGAEYHGYAADVTRTLPVDGQFSAEEKIIYELVLEAQAAGFEACRSGNSFDAPHKAAREVLVKGLLKLGIIKKENEYRSYFMHGTSHYLGLDVHDEGDYKSLKSGNVITVEPGLYIPSGSDCDKKWWNIGVRIEDDVLITDTGKIILSENAPRTVKEIEDLMKLKSKFNK
jgi:Xaa-Pro aminopeptidase